MSDTTTTYEKCLAFRMSLTVPEWEAMIERAANWFDQQDIVNGATGTWTFEWTKPFVKAMLRAALEGGEKP